MNSIAVTPIVEADLIEATTFLHKHLNSRITVQAWKDSFNPKWSQSAPNFGFQLKNGNNIVGIICAIYSEQVIDGKVEHFCNPHSWCVLKDYRKQSINLVLAVLQQKGYHFTMFTPNPDVATVFRYLKFKDLSNAQTLYIHYPTIKRWLSGYRIISNFDTIKTVLHGNDLKVFSDHCHLDWLKHIIFGYENDLCHIIYKPGIYKRLTCANILYVSNAEFFKKYHSLLSHYFLISEKIFLSKIESRFFPDKQRFTFSLISTQPKLFLSKELEGKHIKNIYSELMALDL